MRRAAEHVVHVTRRARDASLERFKLSRVGYAKEVGFATIGERGRGAADDLPSGLVYAGFSLGAMPAQELAQTRPTARARFVSRRVPGLRVRRLVAART